jgi:hypothetical protein
VVTQLKISRRHFTFKINPVNKIIYLQFKAKHEENMITFIYSLLTKWEYGRCILS